MELVWIVDTEKIFKAEDYQFISTIDEKVFDGQNYTLVDDNKVDFTENKYECLAHYDNIIHDRKGEDIRLWVFNIRNSFQCISENIEARYDDPNNINKDFAIRYSKIFAKLAEFLQQTATVRKHKMREIKQTDTEEKL